jgi:DNA-binding NarL/FixJ family response regulator
MKNPSPGRGAVPAARGGLPWPKNPGEGLLSAEDWERLAAYLGLTAREAEVAALLLEGLNRGAVARRLGRAPGTVRVYIDRLFRKLDVRDRVGLVLRIVRVHLALAVGCGR